MKLRTLAAALAISLATSASALAQYTLKIGHVAPASEIADDHVAAVYLKSFIEARSGGRVKANP